MAQSHLKLRQNTSDSNDLTVQSRAAAIWEWMSWIIQRLLKASMKLKIIEIWCVDNNVILCKYITTVIGDSHSQHLIVIRASHADSNDFRSGAGSDMGMNYLKKHFHTT